MAYREDRGWGFGDGKSPQSHVVHLEQQVAELQQRVEQLESATGRSRVIPTPDNLGGGI
jgi:hypothetical protein